MLRRRIPTTTAFTATARCCAPATAVIASPLPFTSQRSVQFRKTTEMFKAVNSRKNDGREEWVTQSTADFAERLKIAQSAGIKVSDKMRPGVSTLLQSPPKQMDERFNTATSTKEMAAQAREPLRGDTSSDPKTAKEHTELDDKVQKHREEFDASTYEHWERIKTFKTARAGRFKQYFAQYGWGFFTWYCVIYAASFTLLYFLLKTKFFDYRSGFEYVYCLTAGAMDRPAFFETLDNKSPMFMDVSFTFMLNEVLDFWRLPFAIGTFWSFRHWWLKNPGKTMMRDMQPEKAIEFKVKRRDAERMRLMKGFGGTASTCATTPKPVK